MLVTVWRMLTRTPTARLTANAGRATSRAVKIRSRKSSCTSPADIVLVLSPWPQLAPVNDGDEPPPVIDGALTEVTRRSGPAPARPGPSRRPAPTPPPGPP